MFKSLKNRIKIYRIYITLFFKWVVIAAVTGIIGGLTGVAFNKSITWATGVRMSHWYFIFILPVAGLAIIGLYRLCGIKKDKGTNRILASARGEADVPIAVAPTIFVSTVLTHLFGGSAGREGAALQLGGCIGFHVGKLFRLREKKMHPAIICGMSAVFSALFGTPVTSIFFAIEVANVGMMNYAAFFPCLVSAFTAYAITLIFHIEPTHFILKSIPVFGINPIWQTLVIAVLCAFLSSIFCTIMHYTAHLYRKYFKNSYIRAAVGGAIIVALTMAVRTTDYNGTGVEIIRNAMNGNAFAGAFALKIVFTALTLGCGYKGGEIVPTFFIGATFGCVIARLIGLDPGFGAAIGLVALFCGVVNCPVTSIFLAVELFGAQGLLFYVICIAVSYMLSGYRSLYGSQKIMFSKFRDKHININARL